jgi:hypothetical protein
VWYDDPASLRPKYVLAASLGLRGVGPFTFDYLDYTGDDTGSPVAVQQAKDM